MELPMKNLLFISAPAGGTNHRSSGQFPPEFAGEFPPAFKAGSAFERASQAYGGSKFPFAPNPNNAVISNGPRPGPAATNGPPVRSKPPGLAGPQRGVNGIQNGAVNGQQVQGTPGGQLFPAAAGKPNGQPLPPTGETPTGQSFLLIADLPNGQQFATAGRQVGAQPPGMAPPDGNGDQPGRFPPGPPSSPAATEPSFGGLPQAPLPNNCSKS